MLPKRKVSHRFFHTLVFSSFLVLDGCASAPAPVTTPLPIDQETSSAAAAETSTVAVHPDLIAMGEDARFCEVGWPTTKAGNGNAFLECKTVERADGSDVTECTDQEGRCVRQ